uniref:Uncharacterized protein n=1 Tax=Anguilla anguilla TaxID=7936 RepID=A0A0E9PT63_ANGAN
MSSSINKTILRRNFEMSQCYGLQNENTFYLVSTRC